ncbi:MAG TPA: GreA/GreB family elongation factor [Actinocatenispora sp.]
MVDPDQPLRDELAELEAERARLVADRPADREPGDSADEAQEIGLSTEISRLDGRITDLRDRLEYGDDSIDGPALGTVAVLRYPDGSTERVEVAAGPADGAITRDSPLAQALTGHSAGDTVTWHSPSGPVTAHLDDLRTP